MRVFLFFFFFNDTATTEIYTLSLHDALPISPGAPGPARGGGAGPQPDAPGGPLVLRSEGGGPVGELYMGALPGPNSLAGRGGGDLGWVGAESRLLGAIPALRRGIKAWPGGTSAVT